MASRKKEDCNFMLMKAYDLACNEFYNKYPKDAQPFITCTYRSNEEQNELYTKVPKVTNAKAGQSPHNYFPSLAFDIAFIKDKTTMDWSEHLFKNFADIIINIEPNIIWGGSFKGFKDMPHFEIKNWKGLAK